ncbi:MAG: helix-turn-helix domain-containing protein [bacterium]|nr:helix-turn-helix domain-containing protein [bacterium]
MFEHELKAFGLTEKEALVYMGLLELGKASMIEIAKKSGVNRATSYVAVESLIKKGLASSFEKGGKRYFAAENPERLRSLFAVQHKQLEEKEKYFDAFLPKLKELAAGDDERPRVRFYEGKEGLRAIQEDILKTPTNQVDEIASLDVAFELFPPSQDDHRRKFWKKFTKNRLIYTRRNGSLPLSQHVQMKWISEDTFSFQSELVLCGDSKVILNSAPMRGKLFGVIIESKELCESFRSLFNFVWDHIPESSPKK